jgi:hypothetical protein
MRRGSAVRGPWLPLVVGLAAVCAGCPSFSTLQTPRTVPEGELRFGALAGGAGALSDDTGPGPRSAQFELSARYGLSERVDVGVKLYALGIEASLKWWMVRGPLDLAIAPAVSYASFDDRMGTQFNAFYAHLPLLMGWNLSDRVTLSFGPKLMFGYQFRRGDVVRDDLLLIDGLLVGAYVSVPIRIGRAFWIAPEINAYSNLSNGAIGDTTIYQGGIAFMFGGAETPAPPDDDEEDEEHGLTPPPGYGRRRPPPPRDAAPLAAPPPAAPAPAAPASTRDPAPPDTASTLPPLPEAHGAAPSQR